MIVNSKLTKSNQFLNLLSLSKIKLEQVVGYLGAALSRKYIHGIFRNSYREIAACGRSLTCLLNLKFNVKKIYFEGFPVCI